MKALRKAVILFFLVNLISAQNDSLHQITVGNSNLYFENVDFISSKGDTTFVVNEFGESIRISYSLDGGKHWEMFSSYFSETVKIPSGRKKLSAIRLSNDRIFAGWIRASNQGYDQGFALTSTGDDYPHFVEFHHYPLIFCSSIQLSQGFDDQIYIAIGNNHGYTRYYKTSSNDLSLKGPFDIDTGSFESVLSLIHTSENNIIAIYSRTDAFDFTELYIRRSTDNGATWSARAKIPNTTGKSNKNFQTYLNSANELFVTYEIENISPFINPVTNEPFVSKDVFYYKSLDLGLTWSNHQVTTFVGDDLVMTLSEIEGNMVIMLFTRGRYSFPNVMYLCYIEDFIDPSPPIIRDLKFTGFAMDQPFIARAYIEDNFDIPNGGIESVLLLINNLDSVYLYDDGLHNDSLANDNIWGNTIPAVSDQLPRNDRVIDINNIKLSFDNRGVLAEIGSYFTGAKATLIVTDNNQNVRSTSRNLSDGGYVRGGIYDDIVFLFGGGFIMTGRREDGTIWANGATGNYYSDYLPGIIGSAPNDPLNQIYVVKRTDIPFSSSWQYWADAVELGAKFYDGDGDGVYNPIDKNGNGQWDPDEDMPDLLYDATYFTAYNDGKPANERPWGAEPLGIEIQQTIFASLNNSILDDVIFIRYTINNSGDPLNDIYFTIYADADLGDYQDDIFGSDSLLNSSFYYNIDDDTEYGTNTPSFFVSILQGPVVESPGNTAFNNFGPTLGQVIIPDHKNLSMTASTVAIRPLIYLYTPQNSEQMFNYTRGLLHLGDIPDPCDFYYSDFIGSGCQEVNPYIWFSGDPVTHSGWLMQKTYDIRGYTSTGPFNLSNGESQEIIVAYVVGRGIDHLNSIDRAREITRYVNEEYQRNFSTLVSAEDNNEELPAKFYLSQNYPNPFNPSTKIRFAVPSEVKSETSNTKIVVYDILGREVKTLLNEVKTPGNYEITFDASQLASGVYFYRLTSGNFVQTKKMILLR